MSFQRISRQRVPLAKRRPSPARNRSSASFSSLWIATRCGPAAASVRSPCTAAATWTAHPTRTTASCSACSASGGLDAVEAQLVGGLLGVARRRRRAPRRARARPWPRASHRRRAARVEWRISRTRRSPSCSSRRCPRPARRARDSPRAARRAAARTPRRSAPRPRTGRARPRPPMAASPASPTTLEARLAAMCGDDEALTRASPDGNRAGSGTVSDDRARSGRSHAFHKTATNS